jgi:non-ribosomal peptide synthetase component E (peptide arylation enzyme)
VMCPITAGIGNSTSTLAAGYAGCKVVLQERFKDTETLDLIEKEKPTVIVGVPTQFIKVLAASDFDKRHLESLRLVITAGSYFPYEKAKELIRRMRIKLISVFGSHDGGTITVSTPDETEELMCRTVGQPLPGTDVRIVDGEGCDVQPGEVGEIVYRSANACIGYFGDVEGTKSTFDEDGFFHSGDLVRLTPEECLEVKGRSKDIIIRGGLNINPGEVEDILIEHPDIENVAIVGMPDPILGERSCAYAVAKKGKTFTFEKMVSFLKEKGCATFKLPERLEVVHDIPLSEGKKPAKNILKKDIEEKLRREGVIR